MLIIRRASPSSSKKTRTHPTTIRRNLFLSVACAIVDRSSSAFRSSVSSGRTSATVEPPNIINTRRPFPSTLQIMSDDERRESDDGSEPHDPRRGRPGIVVFSGGTAFNSAAAEMASRITQVGIRSGDGTGLMNSVDDDDDKNNNNDISRENSLVDLMTLGSVGMSPEEGHDDKTSFSTETPATKLAGSKGNKPNAGIAGGTKVWHVLPVTDDGGSTAEIVRVLGGPAVGDIRSRLLRLAPGTTNEARAVRRLLGHRLVSMESWKEKHGSEGMGERKVTKATISRMAREEWLDILDGGNDGSREHPLWKEVSTPFRSIVRSFLVHFHAQVLQTHNGLRHSQSSPPFDFTGGSVGNFFFAGARTFFGSLPAAIFLFSKVAEIPAGSRVLPAVLTEERLVLGAELKNKMRIRGQYHISHPRPKFSNASSAENENTPGHRPVVKSGKIESPEDILSLHPSPISRITYLLHDPTWQRRNQPSGVNPNKSHDNKAVASTGGILDWNDRHEIFPEPNPLVLDAICNANCIVYGCGSLFTSVLPSLVLSGVGEAIAERNDRPFVPKILLLNGWHDRETGWSEPVAEDNERMVKRMDATAFVQVIVNALDQGGKWSNLGDLDDTEQTHDDEGTNLGSPPLVTDYITHILYPIGTEIEMNEQSLDEYCQQRERLCERLLGQSPKHPLEREQQFPNPSTSKRQEYCTGRTREIDSIKLIGVPSVPANACFEGSRSGGQTCHRVFHPPSLVDAILDLANGGGSRQFSSS